MTKLLLLLVVLGVTFFPVLAQDQPTAQSTPQPTEDQEKEKAEQR